jgi:hypothetical protein
MDFSSFLCFHPLACPVAPEEWYWRAPVMIFFRLSQVGGHQNQVDSMLNYPLNNVKISDFNDGFYFCCMHG